MKQVDINNPVETAVLYVIGPMRGIEEFNFPAFKKATGDLRAAGYTVVCPTELHGDIESLSVQEREASRLASLRTDIAALVTRCNGIAYLPHFGGSSGARLEYEIGKKLSLSIFSVEAWTTLATNGSFRKLLFGEGRSSEGRVSE